MENENLFSCESIEDVQISEGNGFFNPEEGKATKFRFLAGPLLFYKSQEYDKENKKFIGEKKFYSYGDNKIKTDKHANLVLGYIVFDYSSNLIQPWEITTKGLIKSIQAINDMNPDLSKFDCSITKKKGANGFNEYHLVTATSQTAFNNKEAIDEWKNNKPWDKYQELIAQKIEETANMKSLDDEEAEIEAEIKSKKEVQQVFE